MSKYFKYVSDHIIMVNIIIRDTQARILRIFVKTLIWFVHMKGKAENFVRGI
jgi:hypothetical protein